MKRAIPILISNVPSSSSLLKNPLTVVNARRVKYTYASFFWRNLIGTTAFRVEITISKLSGTILSQNRLNR